jgi:ligand-binding SRPBCC domain-containing protein
MGKPERAVYAEATVDAPLSQVWQAWTTVISGLKLTPYQRLKIDPPPGD